MGFGKFRKNFYKTEKEMGSKIEKSSKKKS